MFATNEKTEALTFFCWDFEKVLPLRRRRRGDFDLEIQALTPEKKVQNQSSLIISQRASQFESHKKKRTPPNSKADKRT